MEGRGSRTPPSYTYRLLYFAMSEEASILIVDDDAEDLASLKKALEALVATIDTLSDPHEVLELTRRENPDVVILDALLPGLSGFDLCKQIKSDSALKAIQVVVITGVYLRKQYRQEALQQFKADGFMTKPYKPLELQRLVTQLLAKKTRRPQKSFLRRSGGAADTSEPKKRGFWNRLLGRSEPEAADTRISPAARPPRAAPMASAPKPDPGPSHVAVVETPVVTKLAEPEPVALNESPKSEVSRTTIEPESKPDAVVESAATIGASPEVSTEKSEEPAIAKEIESSPVDDSEPVATVDDSEPVATADEEALAPHASEESSGETASADKAPAPATEPVVEAASVEVEEAVSVVNPAAPAVSKEPSAVDRRPVPKAPDEEHSEASDERVEPSEAEEAEPAEPVASASASEASKEDDEAPLQPAQPDTGDAPAETLALAPEAAREDEKVQWTEPSSSASIETQADVPEEPEPEPKMRKSIFRVREVPVCDEQEFHSELKREISKCRRVDRPLTVILIQVEDLSQIVELFGKETREAVLMHVAELATWCLREVDLVGMMTSKDLVAIIAFASDKYGGSRIVDRMRKTVQKNPFRVGEELPPIMPALRFGMSSYPDDGEDVVGLIAEAYADIGD